MNQIKWLCRLLTLPAENAFLRPRHLKHILTHFEHFRWAWIPDSLLLFQSDINGIIDSDLRLRIVSGQSTGGPFRMHLANTLLNIKANVYFLVSCQLDNRYAQWFVFIYTRKIGNRANRSLLLLFVIHVLKHFTNVQSSDFSNLLVLVLDVKDKILLTNATILNLINRTLTLPRVLEIINHVADKRNQTDPLTEPFVMQNWSVFYNANKMWSQSRNLWNEYSSQRVGKTYIATSQWKLHPIRSNFQDFDVKFIHCGFDFNDSKYY